LREKNYSVLVYYTFLVRLIPRLGIKLDAFGRFSMTCMNFPRI